MVRRLGDLLWRARRRSGEPTSLSAEVPADLRETAQRLEHALSEAGTPEEATGERGALTAYRTVFGATSPTGGLEGRRDPMVLSLTGARIGVAAAGAVLLGLGGLSAAAYSGALPAPAQNVAHEAIGAPAAEGKAHRAKHAASGVRVGAPGTPPSEAVGPDARGPAAYGLCNAFDPAKDKGEARKNSVAYRNLVRAAGGESKLKAYCDSVATRKDKAAKPAKTAKPDDRATGKPSDKATGRPTGKPQKSGPATPSATPPTTSATRSLAPAPTTTTTTAATTTAASPPATRTASSATTG